MEYMFVSTLLKSECIFKLQVVILHHMLSKATVKARPTVLWCYKKELGFSRYEFILKFGKKHTM